MVLTAGCHYSRSEGRQQDKRKEETANKGRRQKVVGGEGGGEGPEEERVKRKMGKRGENVK